MEALIKVTQQKDGKQVVSARELYEFLGYAKTQWKRWYKKNVLDNPFLSEGSDYKTLDIVSNGNQTKDFALTIDCAKRLSMMAKTEKGEEARNYFIQCEKKLIQVQRAIEKPMTPAEFLLQQAKAMVAYEQRVTAIEEDVTRLKAERRNRPEGLSVMAYGVIHHIPVNLKLASIVGRKAAKICRDKGIPVGRLKDPRFGYVGEYPEEVLEQAFEEAQK